MNNYSAYNSGVHLGSSKCLNYYLEKTDQIIFYSACENHMVNVFLSFCP